MSTDYLGDALRATCMKARIATSSLGLTRTDKSAAEKVVQDAHAIKGAARVGVNRLAGADGIHKRITAAQDAAKRALVKRSMPFNNEDGWRLLPSKQFDPLLVDLNVCKKEFDAAMAELATQADNILAQARANIGDLQVELPTKEELLSAYTLKTAFEPIPEGKFNGLPEAMANRLSRNFEASMTAAVNKATTDTMQRFVTPLSNFVERMEAYDEREAAIAVGKDVGRVGVFRDTAITNIKELFDVLESFNIAGDERLAELGNRLASLANVKPDALRDNAAVREDAVKRARAAMADLNEWLAPPPAAAA